MAEATASKPVSKPVSSKVVTMLKLSEEDVAVYDRLWAEATPIDNVVKAASAVKFLQSSGPVNLKF